MSSSLRPTVPALVALLLAACSAGHAPAPTPAAPSAPAASAQPTPAAAEANSADSAKVPEPAQPQSHAPGVEMPSVDFSEREDGVDGWLKSKGIPDTSSKSLIELAGLPESMNVECDSVVPVGKPFEQAALCRRQALQGQWEMETSYLLLVPEGGKLRVVWKASSAAGVLNRSDTSEQPFVQLDVALQDDGQVLFLEDVPAYACSDGARKIAEARAQAQPDENVSYANLDRMAASVCRARGKYAWRNSTFVRVGPVPKSRD